MKQFALAVLFATATLFFLALKAELARRARSQRESETNYRDLFANMRNGVAHCRMLFEGDDPRDFVYLDVNKAFEVQTGLKGVVGRKVSEVIPGIRDADPKIFEIYGRVARTGAPEKIEVYVAALSQWFDISVYRPAPGEFVAVFDVITARKNAETEIARLTEEKIRALQAEAAALRSREQLAKDMMANLSHELRTPLAAIKGFAETLRLGAVEDAENRLGFVETIERHADRLSLLVEDMLLLSDLDHRAESPEFEFKTTELAAFVEQHVQALCPVIKAEGVTVKIDIAPDLKVRADAENLTRIFHNLLDNALKYNRSGGGVGIEARADGGRAVVTVRDSGRGIPQGDLEMIFGRFYRCRATRHIRGTGLGLPIVKAIVELHGGRIWVESVYSKGSAFHFTLPLAS